MKVIKATQQMLETRTLVLGFQGENLRTQLRIDCAATFAEYPNATPALAIKPPSGETYPVFVDRDGNEVVWDIVANNLVLKGDGELQLTFYKDNVIAKTSIGHITVNRSLQIDGEMPDVVATWIENANRKLAEVDAQIVELEGMVDTATDAATRAEQSASTASTKAEQAAGSAATATEKATEATNAAGTATAKAAEAALSATQAGNSAMSAANSESGATAKAAEAAQSAQTAAQKAEQITEAAQIATGKAGEASASATAAQASASNAASSATAASESETAAKASETAAGASATQAAQSAQGASADAQTATQKAAEATQSATNAATSAETASTKAGEAAQSAQAASDAKTAVEQTAEQLADSLEQIEQNTQDIAELDERKANVDGYYPDMTVGNAEQLNSSKYVENSEPYTFRTSGGSSDIGNREYLDAVVGGTAAWNQMVRDEASENSTDFAPIVTVTDAVEDAVGVKVKIEPVQDLHGYDHPWPAGGGKNLLPIDEVFHDDSTDSITIFEGSISGTYTFGIDTSGVTSSTAPNAAVCSITVDGTDRYDISLRIKQKTYTGTITKIVVFSANSYTKYRGTIKFQLESGSTATEWTPSSNICPITGWDGVKVTRTGKNLFDVNHATLYPSISISDGELHMTTATWMSIWIANRIVPLDCKTGQQYTLSAQIKSETANNVGIAVVYTDGTITYGNRSDVAGSYFLSKLTTEATKTVSGFGLAYNASAVTTDIKEIQLELSSTATDFEPYAGQTYDITLPTEAGTVYGGELTVNADGSGSLVVDKASVDLGTLAWRYIATNNGVFYANLPQEAKLIVGTAGSLCSMFKPTTGNDWQYLSNGDYILRKELWSLGYCSIAIRNNDYIETEAFKTAVTGQTLVYPLATLTTYTLTASQIRTLLGTNNIWADTGDLALTYTGTDEHLTLASGKKYLSRISGTDSMLLGSGQEIIAAKGTDNVFDLTQMFGSAVADYVYGQGAGFFRKWFGKTRYPYNAGELLSVEGLQSHDMVGFNQWDEEWENGFFSYVGVPSASTTAIRSKNFCPCVGGTTYYYFFGGSTGTTYILWYDRNQNIIGNRVGAMNATITSPLNAAFFKICTNASYDTTYKHDICINLSHNGSRNGEYEPYEKHSYPLDSSVILRGIPKVGANGVYWDGDRYLPDGTVERRYGVVDLGTLTYNTPIDNRYYTGTIASLIRKKDGMMNIACAKFNANASLSAIYDMTDGMWVSNQGNVSFSKGNYATAAAFKAAMSGVLLVYELATPTTETAQPYHSTQWVSDWGTEEFVSTGLVPVGTETRYPANLRDKLQHLPDAASGNGSYLITQTDGQMVLTPFPAPPSTAGNYVLKATVVNGVATYTWEVAT